MRALVLLAIALAGCASHADLAMLNPATGRVVGCERPNDHGTPGQFLTSRMCVSACQAHGFRPILGEAPPDEGTPGACLN